MDGGGLAMNPDEVRECLQVQMRIYDTPANEEKLRGIRGIVRKYLGEIIQDDSQRKVVMCWLLRPDEVIRELSTSELAPKEVVALKNWIGSQKVGDDWIPRRDWYTEVKLVWDRALLDYGRQTEGVLYENGMVAESLRLGGVIVRRTPIYMFD